MWIYVKHTGLLVRENFQCCLFLRWKNFRINDKVVSLQDTLTSDRKGTLAARWIPPFAFHLLSLLWAAVFCQSPHGNTHSVLISSSACLIISFLSFKTPHTALGNQSSAELSFHLSTSGFISYLSLIHYSTIFVFVHLCLYSKWSTHRQKQCSRASGFTLFSLELKVHGAAGLFKPPTYSRWRSKLRLIVKEE